MTHIEFIIHGLRHLLGGLESCHHQIKGEYYISFSDYPPSIPGSWYCYLLYRWKVKCLFSIVTQEERG